jgi:hypothetical protein
VAVVARLVEAGHLGALALHHARVLGATALRRERGPDDQADEEQADEEERRAEPVPTRS